MRYGIALPNFTDLATPESIQAAAETADRLGWADVWTTDHVLVDRSHASADYYVNFDALETLAWVGARHSNLGLGTSVIVVPQRSAVVLAKQIATLDSLSAGRVIAGIGIGWNEKEFGNLGFADRFHHRGAYLDETVRLWRHLWSGSSEPFDGRFHPLDDFVFGPLPAQRSSLPIWIGGRAEPALRRVGRLADGYHSSATSPSAYAERLPVIKAAAHEAGRPVPTLSARARVQFDVKEGSGYAMRGSPEDVAAEVRAFADLGVEHMALWFGERSPELMVAAAERFNREVEPLV